MLEVRLVSRQETESVRLSSWERGRGTVQVDDDRVAIEIAEATLVYDVYGRPAVGLKLAGVAALDRFHEKQVAYIFDDRVLFTPVQVGRTLGRYLTIVGLSAATVDEVLDAIQGAL